MTISNTSVYGITRAIYSARNAMNSWDKSDSFRCLNGNPIVKTIHNEDYDYCQTCPCVHNLSCENDIFVVGKNDLELAKKLCKAGSDHRKFMRMIHVQCDITAPTYWIAEHDTYKIATTRNSCSFMHKGTVKEFTRELFTDDDIYACDFDYSTHAGMLRPQDVFALVLDCLNELRETYNNTKDFKYFRAIRQMLPSGYNILYTWDASYETLHNIYHSRKNHKLSEWHVFCEWIESLPYSELITGGSK